MSGSPIPPATSLAATIRRRLIGRHVVVMGLGRFGGGVGATRWLAGAGARVTVSDQAAEADLGPSIERIADRVADGTVELELGGHVPATFAGADLVVVNPAVPRPWDNPAIRTAVEAGVPLTTEIELLARQLPRERTAAITGTTGKSTVTTLTGRALEAVGRTVHLGGNLGGSLLAIAAELGAEDLVVLELSSFQLFWLGADRPGRSIADWFDAAPAGDVVAPGWSPRVAAWTNLTANHLDWHVTMEHYRRSKDVIRAFQIRGDVCIGPDAPPRWPSDAALGLPGEHNRANAALAVEVAAALLAPVTADDAARAPLDPSAGPSTDPRPRLRAALADATGLPHRLQTVHEAGGIVFVDDSKCTTPDGVALAVAAMRDRHPGAELHVIVGGADKGLALDSIAALAGAAPPTTLHAIGATGPAIVAAAASSGAPGGPASERVAERHTVARAVDAAVHAIRAERRAPDRPAIVLLSPGCASWDQYPNYIARGEDFAGAARAIATD